MVEPQRGDIVVFYSPYDGTRLVKRVVGLPGDTVELRNEQLVINGEPAIPALPAEISAQLPETNANTACSPPKNCPLIPTP